MTRADWCPAHKELILYLKGQGGAHAQLQMNGMGSTKKEEWESSMGKSSQGRLPGRGGTYWAIKNGLNLPGLFQKCLRHGGGKSRDKRNTTHFH